MHRFFRLFSGARVKIVWTTYQIIGSVAWGVNVSWPEPFKSFTSGLQALYFVAVGGECFSPGYNYYIKLLLMTLWPIALALLIFAPVAALDALLALDRVVLPLGANKRDTRSHCGEDQQGQHDGPERHQQDVRHPRDQR